MSISTWSWRGPVVLAAAVGALLGPVGVAAATPGPTPSPVPSAVGPAFVTWLAVSPAYRHSGVVAAVGHVSNCSKDCDALWVSHDGGSTWHRAAAKNWQPNRVVIAVDAQGHDILYGMAPKLLMRSADLGETFQAAGSGGMPTILPGYSADGALAVAAFGQGSDYVVRGGAAHDVSGSNSTAADLQFLASPQYPNGGSWSPALLAAMEPRTQQPVVLHCTADFTCTTPTVIVQPSTQPAAMTTVDTLLYASEDYAEHGSVFVDTPVGVQKSLDGGATFTPLNVLPTAGADRTATPAMALAPGYREAGPVRTAYVAVYQAVGMQTKQAHTAGGIYMTSDGGSTWAPLATTGPFAGGSQALAIAPDGRLFASYTDRSGNNGVLCSADGGASWHASCPSVGDHAAGGGGASGTSGGSCSGTACAGSGSQAGAASGNSPGASGDTAASPGLAPAGATQGTTATGHGSRWWVYPVLAVAAILAAAAGVSPLRGILARRRARHRVSS